MLILTPGAIVGSQFDADADVTLNKSSAANELIALTFGSGYSHVSNPGAQLSGFTYLNYTYFNSSSTDYYAAFLEQRSAQASGSETFTVGSPPTNPGLFVAEIPAP